MDYLMIFATLGLFLVLFIVCLALFDDPKEPLLWLKRWWTGSLKK